MCVCVCVRARAQSAGGRQFQIKPPQENRRRPRWNCRARRPPHLHKLTAVASSATNKQLAPSSSGSKIISQTSLCGQNKAKAEAEAEAKREVKRNETKRNNLAPDCCRSRPTSSIKTGSLGDASARHSAAPKSRWAQLIGPERGSVGRPGVQVRSAAPPIGAQRAESREQKAASLPRDSLARWTKMIISLSLSPSLGHNGGPLASLKWQICCKSRLGQI